MARRSKWALSVLVALLGGCIVLLPTAHAQDDAELEAIGAAAIDLYEGDPLTEGEDWELMSALTRWLDPSEDERVRRLDRLMFPAPVGDLGETPEEILVEVEANIALVPYSGSMRDAATLRDSRTANTLDRARLLASALDSRGYETRIVGYPIAAGAASVTYAVATPTLPPAEDNDLIAWLAEQAAAGAAAAETVCAANLCSEWIARSAENHSETTAYWPQYQRDGGWVDLRPADISAPSTAEPNIVGAEDLESLRWTIEVRFETGSGRLLVAATVPAEQLHARTISFIGLPNDDLSTIVPNLTFGTSTIPGEMLPVAELDSGILATVVAHNLDTERTFRRIVVPPRSVANDIERVLELSALAKITVLTAPLSQDESALGIAQNARNAARVLFDLPSESLSERLPPSLPALAVLDASLRTAGHLGNAAQETLSFQAAPAIVLEVESVVTIDDANSRVSTFDILDGGHGLLTDTSDRLVEAAFEQAFVDGAIESWVVGTPGSETSLALVSDQLSQGANFLISREPEPHVSQIGHPSLYMAVANSDGQRVGFRFDGGPQILLTLDGRGGVSSTRERLDRLETLCDRLQLGALFIPASVLPAGFLAGPFVRFQCKVAEAYECAASALDDIFNPGAAAECEAKALEDLLLGMGEDFAKDLLVSTVTHTIVGSTVGPAVDHVARNWLGPSARWLGGRVSRYIANNVIGRGSRAPVAGAAEHFARSTYMAGTKALLQEMKKAGWSQAERRLFLEKYGCFVAGTLVHTPDGLKQIEDIAEGDIVYALNLATGKQVARPVLGAIETHPQACVSISLSDGTTIETTPDHRFYEGSLESWVAAESLGPGSQLVSGDTDVTVYSVAGMRCPAPAYSITVEADANFLVGINGVLAHNDDLCQINRNIVRQGVKDGQSVDDIVRALRGQPPVQTTKAMRELIRQARAIKDSVLQKHPSLILPGTKTIAVAPSFPDGRTSGYKHIDDVERVLVKGNGLRPFGYSIRGAGSFDPIRKAGDAYGPVGKRATGLYNASHAEKQMNHVLGAKDEPTGISKFMCGDCLSYFRATARSTGRDYVFADPYTTYYFRANGQVVVVPH